jgi:hypothetical protein
MVCFVLCAKAEQVSHLKHEQTGELNNQNDMFENRGTISDTLILKCRRVVAEG